MPSLASLAVCALVFAMRAAAQAPVTATQDAAVIRLDNGLVSLEYSKTTAMFRAIYRHVDGKRHKDFPDDVTFTVGASDPAKDWNYAQWALFVRKPVWTIRFPVSASSTGPATLTLAFSSAQPQRGPVTNLEVKVNGTLVDTIHLPKTGTAGYRGGAQDSPWNVRTLNFDAALLHPGINELTLGHTDARRISPDGNITGAVGQVMYDAIRLELARPQ